jgi:hypothetical protein
MDIGCGLDDRSRSIAARRLQEADAAASGRPGQSPARELQASLSDRIAAGSAARPLARRNVVILIAAHCTMFWACVGYGLSLIT